MAIGDPHPDNPDWVVIYELNGGEETVEINGEMVTNTGYVTIYGPKPETP